MNDNFHNVTRTATGVEDEDDYVDGDDMESVHFGYMYVRILRSLLQSPIRLLRLLLLLPPLKGTKSSHPVIYDSAAGMRLVNGLRILTTKYLLLIHLYQ